MFDSSIFPLYYYTYTKDISLVNKSSAQLVFMNNTICAVH